MILSWEWDPIIVTGSAYAYGEGITPSVSTRGADSYDSVCGELQESLYEEKVQKGETNSKA